MESLVSLGGGVVFLSPPITNDRQTAHPAAPSIDSAVPMHVTVIPRSFGVQFKHDFSLHVSLPMVVQIELFALTL